MVRLNAAMCKGCAFCVKYCPKRIIQMGNQRNESGLLYPVFSDSEECTSCCICAVMCPESAIEILDGGVV